MTVTWHLRGFDHRTEREGVDIDIPQAMLPVVREIAPQTKNDPDLVDPHELTRDQAVRLAELLSVSVDPDRYTWSVESEEDWRIVAAQKHDLRAKA